MPHSLPYRILKGIEYVAREILDGVSYDIFPVVRKMDREGYLLILDCLMSMLLFGVGINMTADTVPA